MRRFVMDRLLGGAGWTAAVVSALLVVGCAELGDGGGGAGPFETVVVDAGHGGHDNGARPVRGLYEKNLTLDTALRLQRALQNRGFRVVMTRTDDYFITLGQRAETSNHIANSIFVSVHYNWDRGRSGHGIETYYYSPRAQHLATNIQSRVTSAYPTYSRGIKNRGFYVLRKNNRPAVLVECGFVSNPGENNSVQNPATRQRIAEQIAAGIAAERGNRVTISPPEPLN